jgi:hypothetical protein
MLSTNDCQPWPVGYYYTKRLTCCAGGRSTYKMAIEKSQLLAAIIIMCFYDIHLFAINPPNPPKDIAKVCINLFAILVDVTT